MRLIALATMAVAAIPGLALAQSTTLRLPAAAVAVPASLPAYKTPKLPDAAARAATAKTMTGKVSQLGKTFHFTPHNMTDPGDLFLYGSSQMQAKASYVNMKPDGEAKLKFADPALQSGLVLVQCGISHGIKEGVPAVKWVAKGKAGAAEVGGKVPTPGEIGSFVVDMSDREPEILVSTPGSGWAFHYCDATPLG